MNALPRSVRIALVIYAIFGLVFVGSDASDFPRGLAAPLQIVALVAAIGLVVFMLRAPRASAAPRRFQASYWTIVGLEIAIGLVGLLVIAGVLHAPLAILPWIAFDVGMHFFGLAAIWRTRPLVWLGGIVVCAGLAGLVLAAIYPNAALIAVVSGALPGFALFGEGYRQLFARSHTPRPERSA